VGYIVYAVLWLSWKRDGIKGSYAPETAHLKAYGCVAYAAITTYKRGLFKLRKLDPRADMGYFMGYDFTNIYRVWIPYQGRVIFTRDVIFDESKFFDGRKEQMTTLEMLELDDLVQRIKLPDQVAQDEAVAEEDNEGVFEFIPESEATGASEDIDHLSQDVELAKALNDEFSAQSYGTPETEEHIKNCIIMAIGYSLIHLPVDSKGCPAKAFSTGGISNLNINADAANVEISGNELKQANRRLAECWSAAFTAGLRFKVHRRELPNAPKFIKSLESHFLKAEFQKIMHQHLKGHAERRSWNIIHRDEAKGHQILGYIWVFTYKTDKHGTLQRYEAKLVVCSNQQEPDNLPTKATTLAATSFRTLMAIVAKFDLETIQLDAINAFVNANLNELMYMRTPLGFPVKNHVLRLNRTLYGLRKSPLLWQKELLRALATCGFIAIP
jgi:hypothetical protein